MDLPLFGCHLETKAVAEGDCFPQGILTTVRVQGTTKQEVVQVMDGMCDNFTQHRPSQFVRYGGKDVWRRC